MRERRTYQTDIQKKALYIKEKERNEREKLQADKQIGGLDFCAQVCICVYCGRWHREGDMYLS